MWKRLYSSFTSSGSRSRPLTSSSSSSSTSAPSAVSTTEKAPTRGRTKPTRPPSSMATRPRRFTRGRRKPLSSTSVTPPPGLSASAESLPSHFHPAAKGYEWRPQQVYPAQMKLHNALLPRHLPIPIHLGSTIYSGETPSPSNLFGLDPPPPSFHQKGEGESIFADHRNVLSALSTPEMVHHLFHPPGTQEVEIEYISMEEGESFLVRNMAEANVRNRLKAGQDWEGVLANLGDPSSASVDSEGFVRTPAVLEDKGRSGAVQASVSDLMRILREMEITAAAVEAEEAAAKDAEEVQEGVSMDSVKRKRKKKISKHKYKKRRKETRAQRKRLGK